MKILIENIRSSVQSEILRSELHITTATAAAIRILGFAFLLLFIIIIYYKEDKHMKYYWAKLSKIISSISRSALASAGTFAAKYQSYLAEENAKVRAEQLRIQHENKLRMLYPEYVRYAGVLMEAINNTCETTKLRSIQKPNQVAVPTWYHENKDGIFWFDYHGRYNSRYDIPANKVERVLQGELNRICAISNLTRVYVHVFYQTDEKLTILLAPAPIR